MGAVIDLLRSTDYSLVEAYSAAFRVMTIPMVIAVIYAIFAFGVLPTKRGEGHAAD